MFAAAAARARADPEFSIRRARVLAQDALGATRTARGSLPDGDLRAIELELAAGALDDALRELARAARGK